MKHALVFVLCLSFTNYQSGFAQAPRPIVPDGRTQTKVTANGNVTGITTNTIRGVNGFNSFTIFNVGKGTTANLFLPSGTTNLLNLVNGAPTTINGLLNSIKNGQVGGHVFFIDPYGMVVGSTGVMNVGALTIVTPTKNFNDNFFDASGNVSDAATTAVLTGNIPLSSDGLILVNGRINALGDIRLAGGQVINSGTIGTGAVFVTKSPNFSDVVNIKGLQAGAEIASTNGNIEIVAVNDFKNSGVISAEGVSGVNGGNISIQTGNDVRLIGDSVISSSGNGSNSSAGNISILANDNAYLIDHAQVAANGGPISGDAGSIELSGKGNLTINGGSLSAGAVNGAPGHILLDPTNDLVVDSNENTGGADITYSADNLITVNPSVTISSRQIGTGTDALNSPSTGNSGNISFEAPQITVSDGASILAHATGGFTPGNITMTATQSASDPVVLPSIRANAQISIGNATISGGNISITADAEADADKSPSGDANVFLNDTSLGTLVGGYGIVSYKAASATSAITIGDSSSAGTASINGTGNVTIKSTAVSTSVSDLVGTSGFAYGQSDSSATATVAKNATVSASGSLAINSASNNTLSVKESTAADSPGVIAVAYGNASSSSTTQIDGSISGSSVQVSATNTNNFETKASAKAFSTSSGGAPAYGGGAGVALGFYQSSATTNVSGSVTSNSTDVTVSSSSTNLQDAVFSSSAVPTSGGFGSQVAQSQNITENLGGYLSQSTLWPSKAVGTGQVGKLGIAASVSYVKGSNTATTTVTGEINAEKNANISSAATDAPQISAAGSVSGQQTGLGGAVAIDNFSNTAGTYVNSGAQVDSLLGSTSITANATMVNPAVDRVDLLADDQKFSGALSGIESVVKDISTGLGLISNPGEFATSFVNAGITTQAGDLGLQGNNLGLAVSVSVLGFTNQATASVTGAGTSVRAGYNPDGSVNPSADGSVNITADASLTSFNVAGTGFKVGQVAKLNPGVNSGSSLGGSVNVISITNNSTAYIGDGTTVKAASTASSNGQVKVASDTETFEVAVAQAGDKAEQFGVSGTVDYLNLNDSSSAYIQSDATVAATNDVDVNAANNLLEFAVGGALGFGGKGQFDVGVNWNDINQTTFAYIGDPSNSRTSICSGCGVTASGNVSADANSSEHLYAITLAAASSGNSLPKADGPLTAEQAANGAGGGYYSFGVSGTIAINQAGSASTPGIVTQAFINNGANVSANKQVNVDSGDSSVIVSAALAGSLAGGAGVDKGSAIAGAYNQNTINKDVEAFTANSNISGDSLSVDATGANQLYAITVGGAVNTTGSGFSIAGAVNNNAVYNNIAASLGDRTTANNIGSGGVTVNAQEGADLIASVAGGFAIGGTVGIGASVDIGNYENTVNASITGNGNVSTTGNVQVTADTYAQYLPIAVSFAGDKSFGAAGSVDWEFIRDTTTSSVAGNVSAGKNLLVGSQDSSSATMIAGGAGIGGSVGVDVSAILPNFSRNTTASIADDANVSAAGSDAAAISYDGQKDVGILLNAHTSGDLQDYVVGGSGSNTVALGGAIIVSQPKADSLNDTTSATIGKNATVNGNNSSAANDQSVSLLATDNSSILDVAGMLALGADAGVGIGYDQIDPTWTVSTSIGTGSTVKAAGNVVLDSSLQNSIQSYAIVGAASGGEVTGSVTGATTIINETSNVDASENGTVNAGGSVEVAANRNTSSLNAGDGNAAVAVSLGAGVGVSLAKITTNDTVDASIGGTGNVTALGNFGDGLLNVPIGQLDSNGDPFFAPFQGVSVTAMSHTSSNPIAAGVAGSGIAGGQGSVLDNSFTETTEAHVDSGAQVDVGSDSGANPSQSVQALATDKTDVNSIAGGLSLGGLALTASVDTETLNRTVNANISGATVNAADNVLVDGSMLGSITSTTVAGSAGGFAADGAVSVINETTNTDAYIDGSADVTAQGDVVVLAIRNTSLTTHDGSVALGGALGANGSVSTVTKNDTVSAYVGDNTVGDKTNITALGSGTGLSVPVDNGGSLTTGTVNGLSVAATAQETLQTIAIGASVTGGFSGSGSVTTNNITENTSAKIEGGATVNGDNTGASSSQGVNVLASDNTTLTSADGAAAVALNVGAGIGAGVDSGNIQKTTVAGIDNGAQVNAVGAFNVDALSTENIDSYVAAVGGSIGVGLAGTTADYSTHPISPTTTAYIGSCTTSEKCSGGATVNTGSLGLDANDDLTFNVTTGEISAGAAALGAATFEVTADANTTAYIGALSKATVTSGGIDVNSEFTDNLSGKALAGSGGAVISGEAAYSTTTDNSSNSAYIADGANVTSKGDLDVEATTNRTDSGTTSGLSVGGLAAGASISIVNVNGTTEAYIGKATATSKSGAINVDANLTDNSTATSNGIGGGVASGVGTHPQVTDNTNTYAYATGGATGGGVVLSSLGTTTIEAQANRTATSSSGSTSVGGVAVGVSLANVSIGGTTEAYLDSLDSGAHVGSSKASSGGLDVKASEIDNGTATATPLAGGVFSGTGGQTTDDIKPTVSAYDKGATVNVSGAMSVETLDSSFVNSTVVATQLGAVTGGSVDAQGSASPTISASVNGGDANAGSIAITAEGYQSMSVHGTSSASSSFVSGMSIAATGTVNSTISASVGEGAKLTATNNILVGTDIANQVGYMMPGCNASGSCSFFPIPGVSADGTAGTFNVGSGGTTNATATITSKNSVTIGSATLTSNQGNLKVQAESDNYIRGSDANTYTGSGFVNGGGATSNVTITDNTTTTLQNGSDLQALSGNLQVNAIGADLAYAYASNSNGFSGVAVSHATANTTVNATVTTDLDSGATVEGQTTTISALLPTFDAGASSAATASAALGVGAYATSNLNATGTATVEVFGGATVEGTNSLALNAEVASGGLSTYAYNEAEAGIVPISDAHSNNISTLTALVQADQGSTLKTNSLAINSTVPSTSVYSNTASSEWTDYILCVATLGFYCGGTGYQETSGSPNFTNTITLNSTLEQLADLTINPDGSYTGSFPVQGEDGSNIVLQPVNGNQLLPATITLNAPGGTVQGNMTVNPSAEIVNNSDLNLVLQGITTESSGGSSSNITINAATNSLNTSIGLMPITIENNSGSNVVFAGNVLNPAGSLTVTNQGGSILDAQGSRIQVTSATLDAPHGSIGSVGGDMACLTAGCPASDLQLSPMNLFLTPSLQSLSTTLLPGQLSAVARNDIDINLTPDATPVTGGSTPVVSSVPLQLNNIVAGGDINLSLNPGIISSNGSQTQVNGDYQIPSGDWVGAGGKVNAVLNGVSGAIPALTINGVLSSGFQTISVTANADGTLTSIVSAAGAGSTDLNYVQSAGSVLQISDIDASRSGISITGTGSLAGSGTVAALKGASDITITNHSNLPLATNSILNPGSTGDINIALNGTVTTTPGSYGSQSGQITLSSDSTSVELQKQVSDPNGTVSISSGADITGPSGVTLINSKNIELTAIGGIGPNLGIEMTCPLGVLNAQAGGSIALTANNGDISLGNVISQTGDVAITSTGSIVSASPTFQPNISGRNVTLTAIGGSIGSSGSWLSTESTGILNASAGSSVYLRQIGGDLNAQNILSGNGSVSVLVDNGNGFIQQVSAPQDVLLLVNGKLLNIGQVDANNFKAILGGAGGVATISNMFVGSSLDLTADVAHILRLIHTWPTNPLFLDITTTKGGFNQRPLDPGIVQANSLGTKEHRDREKNLGLRKGLNSENLVVDENRGATE